MSRRRTEDAITLIRHLFAIAALPFVVAVLAPTWIARRYGVALSLDATPSHVVALGIGLCLVLIGLSLFVASLRRFAGEGQGTLAPWDPPRHLVVSGPYRYVRNPMISGVIFVLFGEAVILRSTPHVSWALTFFVINAVYTRLVEEPRLRARFGSAYDEYRANVPRLIPRLTAWRGSR